MDKLIHTVKTLPGRGKRLGNGLALRLSRGNGFCVLGASRVGQPPSEQEMQILCRAVLEIWHPSHVWRGRVEIRRRHWQGRQVEDHIWRLYWPIEALELVYETAVQERLFGE